MDKYEYKVRADEIKDLVAKGEYAQAAEVADGIDWRRVKSVMMLCTISDLYKVNKRYEDARDVLLLAYDRRPGGRTICYSLCELSIKMGELLQAIEYYKEFVQVAPGDAGRYVLQYKIYEAQEVGLEERISVLEEMKNQGEYREKWAYELAYLYHLVGKESRCVEECDELILWFGEGRYVIKALELKMQHQALTAQQQAIYDRRNAKPEELLPEEEEDTPGRTQVFTPVNVESGETTGKEDTVQRSEEGFPENAVETGNTRVFDTKIIRAGEHTQAELEQMDIQVKPVDVGQYNTINLQAELAEGLREIFGEEKTREVVQNRTQEKQKETIQKEGESSAETEEGKEDRLPKQGREEEHTEVFFGETEELKAVDTVRDVTGEIVLEQMRRENSVGKEEQVLTAQPPKELAEVLSQEADGQISFVVPEKENPEKENLEKQITGQISFAEVLAEWEQLKKKNEEKRKEEVRQHVLAHTGAMFTEFEAQIRDGLLEQLERGKTIPYNSLPDTTDTLEAADKEEETKEVLEEVSEEVTEEEEILEEASEEETEEEEILEEVSEEEAEEEEILEEASEEGTEEEEILEEVSEEEAEEEEILEEASEEEAEEEKILEEASEEETEEEEILEEVSEEETEEEEILEEASEEEVPEEQGEWDDENFETEELEEIEEPEEDFHYETETVRKAPKKPIVREKEKVRALTREERELFGSFIQSRSAKEKLVKAIDQISMAAYTGNVIVTGEEGMGIMKLAKNVIREIQMMDSNLTGKIAQISGSVLNKRSVSEILERVKNGALIIEHAADMDARTVGELYQGLQQETAGIVVLMVEAKKAMDRFLKKYEMLQECFTARIHAEALSNDMLVSFGKQYAKEKEYSIDNMGILALHTRIEELQTSDHSVTTSEVKTIIDEAIVHANRKTLRHYFDILFARRYDEEDRIILTERDIM